MGLLAWGVSSVSWGTGSLVGPVILSGGTGSLVGPVTRSPPGCRADTESQFVRPAGLIPLGVGGGQLISLRVPGNLHFVTSSDLVSVPLPYTPISQINLVGLDTHLSGYVALVDRNPCHPILSQQWWSHAIHNQ